MKYIIRKKSPGPDGHNEYWHETDKRPWTRVRNVAMQFDTKESAEKKAMELVIETPRYISRLSVDPIENNDIR